MSGVLAEPSTEAATFAASLSEVLSALPTLSLQKALFARSHVDSLANTRIYLSIRSRGAGGWGWGDRMLLVFSQEFEGLLLNKGNSTNESPGCGEVLLDLAYFKS